MTILETNMIVSDCAEACAFYQTVFGANVRHISTFAKGRNEARIEIAGTNLHLFEANNQLRIFPPGKQDRKVMWWHFICDNVDEVYNRALNEGCESVEDLRNLPDFGVRQGTVQDPFGYAWILTQNIRSLYPAQLGTAQTARQLPVDRQAARQERTPRGSVPIEEARNLRAREEEAEE